MVKRAFKSFVEERDDKYTMELLLLPSALKEELLGLVHSPTSTNTSSLVSGVNPLMRNGTAFESSWSSQSPGKLLTFHSQLNKERIAFALSFL